MKLNVGSISVLGPVDGTVSDTSDTNEHSLILLYKHGQFSALFMGDAPVASEQAMLDRISPDADILPYDLTILKAGHHGSSTSTCPELLTTVSPRLAILSYGKENRYGHPHRETLEKLSEYGIPHLDTAESGAISVYTDGHYAQIKEYLTR